MFLWNKPNAASISPKQFPMRWRFKPSMTKLTSNPLTQRKISSIVPLDIAVLAQPASMWSKQGAVSPRQQFLQCALLLGQRSHGWCHGCNWSCLWCRMVQHVSWPSGWIFTGGGRIISILGFCLQLYGVLHFFIHNVTIILKFLLKCMRSLGLVEWNSVHIVTFKIFGGIFYLDVKMNLIHLAVRKPGFVWQPPGLIKSLYNIFLSSLSLLILSLLALNCSSWSWMLFCTFWVMDLVIA